MNKQIEICCGSYYDALQSYKGGAKRIELNSALHLGGLTPSLASLIMTKQNTNLKVISMVRPRGGGFAYNKEDVELIFQDAKILMENGSDGLAFGFLKEDSTLDRALTKDMVDLIHKYNGEAVFHRAFDCVTTPDETMEALIEIGVDRILTSGLQAKAWDGRDMLAHLQEKYGDKIEILAGSGVNDTNATQLMKETGIYQVHSSCKDWLNDPTTSTKNVTYGYADTPNENNYDVVSSIKVAKLVGSIFNER
ncbi:copper homeostasis protein CutC [Clostridium sp.]|uniref:copper homeostasis protein CutC n=1 Tax=Clostridium sp. TaxID=1506 RepID=UPI0026127FB5|nr:copper homeostasis protein CutC [Clostridium sp.]